MSDSFDLQRFVDAQAAVYRQVIEELSHGLKRTHWMWFTFPQITGLGFSAMAQRFAIGSLAEAVAYLEHDLRYPRFSSGRTARRWTFYKETNSRSRRDPRLRRIRPGRRKNPFPRPSLDQAAAADDLGRSECG
jgi:hypothetical protein